MRYARLIPLACLCAVLSACAGNPVRDALVASGVGAEPKPAPDFIAQSRPASVDFKPIGVAPPPRGMTSKSVADVTRAEAEMDAARLANEARGESARRAGATPAAAPINPKPATALDQ